MSPTFEMTSLLDGKAGILPQTASNIVIGPVLITDSRGLNNQGPQQLLEGPQKELSADEGRGTYCRTWPIIHSHDLRVKRRVKKRKEKQKAKQNKVTPSRQVHLPNRKDQQTYENTSD